jgi:hypothetical protein
MVGLGLGQFQVVNRPPQKYLYTLEVVKNVNNHIFSHLGSVSTQIRSLKDMCTILLGEKGDLKY